MSAKPRLQPGEEIEVRLVNDWRYLVRRAEGGGVFWVVRKSLSQADHGRRGQPLGVC